MVADEIMDDHIKKKKKREIIVKMNFEKV